MVEDDEGPYAVVVNHEEQYSIWPEGRDLPAGWVAVGPVGPKDECLDYIERVWTDMRPRSLRDAQGDSSEPGAPEVDDSLRSLVQEVLVRHEERVDEYADGRPELFGWFVGRILAAAADDDVSPEAVRAELSRQLPEEG